MERKRHGAYSPRVMDAIRSAKGGPVFSTSAALEKYLNKKLFPKRKRRRTIYRSARTGRFVRKRFALKHRSTTVAERVAVG